MPNYIANKLHFTGDAAKIAELVALFSTHYPQTESRACDGSLVYVKGDSFGWLNESTNIFTRRNEPDHVGVPDGFEIDYEKGWTRFPDFAKVIPPPNDDAYNDKPSQEVAKNSPNWWYNWNTKNWGTKWNSSSCEKIADNEYDFTTAWCSVPNIVTIIHQQFPDIEIKYTYADEDSGYNCGTYLFKNGQSFSNIPEGGSKEAYKIYFMLHPDNAANYKETATGYEYIED